MICRKDKDLAIFRLNSFNYQRIYPHLEKQRESVAKVNERDVASKNQLLFTEQQINPQVYLKWIKTHLRLRQKQGSRFWLKILCYDKIIIVDLNHFDRQMNQRLITRKLCFKCLCMSWWTFLCVCQFMKDCLRTLDTKPVWNVAQDEIYIFRYFQLLSLLLDLVSELSNWISILRSALFTLSWEIK